MARAIWNALLFLTNSAKALMPVFGREKKHLKFADGQTSVPVPVPENHLATIDHFTSTKPTWFSQRKWNRGKTFKVHVIFLLSLYHFSKLLINCLPPGEIVESLSDHVEQFSTLYGYTPTTWISILVVVLHSFTTLVHLAQATRSPPPCSAAFSR